MSIVYFDSSALVKLLFTEAGSELAIELWTRCDAPLSSRLAYPEVRAALAAAGRNNDLTPSEIVDAVVEFDRLWAFVRPIELNAQIERASGDAAALHALRGADAVHLASAMAVSSLDLVFATWDRRQQAGALASGIMVAPVVI